MIFDLLYQRDSPKNAVTVLNGAVVGTIMQIIVDRQIVTTIPHPIVTIISGFVFSRLLQCVSAGLFTDNPGER